MVIQKTRILIAGLALILLTLSSGKTSACEFPEVLNGTCPTEEPDLYPKPGKVDRGVLMQHLSWARYKDFRKDKTGDIVLKVCFYEKPAADSFVKTNVATIDFSKNPKALGSLAVEVEKLANRWTSAKYTNPLGDTFESRLKLDFRSSPKVFRLCEGDRTSHIRVAFNRQSKNVAQIGRKHAELAYPNKSTDLVTLTLGVHGTKNRPKVKVNPVLHEFGHAFGFVHEMRHRDWAHCAKAFLPEDFVDKGNMKFGSSLTRDQEIDLAKNYIADMAKKDKRALDNKPLDKTSVMVYKLEQRFFGPDGKNCGIDTVPTKLSDTDIEQFMRLYGRKI